MMKLSAGPAFPEGLVCAVLVIELLLTGCAGTPIRSEKETRAQAYSVAAGYRPGDQKPSLPVLTTDSSLGDFLTFAMLNQPRVEAAYYDWTASIERITTARSLPDPLLTFQMDIQNVLTSIMPGLMMNFPAPGKLRAGGEVASAESRAKYFAFQSAVLESAFEVKRACYQLHTLDTRIRVSRENSRWRATWKNWRVRRTKWARSHCRMCCAPKSSRIGSEPPSPTSWIPAAPWRPNSKPPWASVRPTRNRPCPSG